MNDSPSRATSLTTPTRRVGIIVPCGASALLALIFANEAYSSTSFANLVLFLTVTLGMSALPVLARILSERRMLATRLGAWCARARRECFSLAGRCERGASTVRIVALGVSRVPPHCPTCAALRPLLQAAWQ
jgi:hypothetical protein